MNHRPQRGSALPMVLGCTTLAMIVAVTAWDRAATRRLSAGRQILVAQAEQGAMAGLAVALHQLQSPGDSLDSLAVHAKFWQGTRVEFQALPGEGGLFPRATGIGTVPAGHETITREVEATWGSRPDSRLFGAALTLFDATAPAPTSLEIRGAVRVPAPQAGSNGRVPLPANLTPTEYLPPGIALDTVRGANLYQAALQSDKAHFGGGRLDPSHPAPQDREDLVYTRGDLDLSAPEGVRWSPGPGRKLVVEGRLDIRGPVDLSGWTILAKGPVVIDGKARLDNAFLWSLLPVRLDGESRFQGEMIARGHIHIAGESKVTGPTALAVLRGTTPDDTASAIVLSDRTEVEGYLLALSRSGLLEIGPGARLRGIAVGATVSIDGTLDGCAIGLRAQGKGKIDRTRLPVDFALPARLGQNPGLVMVRKVFR
jgi:hypothetical protein